MASLDPQGSAPASLLVVLPTWVGDFVMSTPALRAVRARFPSAKVTYLHEPNLRELVRGTPWMDDCIEWPLRAKRTLFSSEFRRLVRLGRERRFECALLLSNSFRSALLARLMGARNRVGFDRDGRGWLLSTRVAVPNRRKDQITASKFESLASVKTTPPVRLGTFVPGRPSKYVPMPLVDYYAELIGTLGCPRPSDQFELFTTPDCDASIQRRLSALNIADRPLVALSPGAKFGASKCWAPQRFAEAADRLILDSGVAVVITCGPGEEPIAHAIARSMQQKAHLMLDPLLSLGELKSLISRCSLLIANDAGPRHIAKAFGISVVTVFGPTHPNWTATNYPRERIVRIDVDCGPCQQRTCPLGHLKCMDGVTVEMVVHSAKELLNPPSATAR